MLRLLDVFQESEEGQELIASLDVTENTQEERLEILFNVKILYPGAIFYQHDCGHDDGKPCRIQSL